MSPIRKDSVECFSVSSPPEHESGLDARSGGSKLRCRVFWGSHGCDLPRGHDGPHLCDCADIPPEDGGVGAPPYYGPDTRFYGEDA